MITTQQRTYILKELEAIAGKYNFSYRCRIRNFPKGYTWYKTKRGQRAGDWHTLLVLADKARDLGCEVVFSRVDKYHRFGTAKKFPVACPERLANAITVYLPD